MALPHRRTPCKDCPFRKDSLEGWLGKERITEILEADSFVCHKQTDLQCAGHMLLLKESNSYYRLSLVFKAELGLKGEDLIFSTKQECIDHHDYTKKK